MKTIQVNLAGAWRAENNQAVVYAILMREGVRCGSAGCFLWRQSVLAERPERWNGVPVTLGHPSVNGRYVGVNHNEQTKRTICGTIRHAAYDQKKKAIVAEIVVDIANQNIGKLQTLKEVSIGVFSTDKPESGTYGNKVYNGITQGYEPDHVAILPENETGACSWDDGCGLRLNISEETQHKLLKEFAKRFQILMKDQIQTLAKMENEMNQNQNEEKLLSPCLQRQCDQQEQNELADYSDDQMLMPMDVELEQRRQKKLKYLNQQK